MIRQPIICVMGHVDHGKTTLLDKIRNTTVAVREAGGITQHIGASEVPIDVINKICADLNGSFGVNITLPGLLFIDTPGHEAFTNLRRRGGSVADMAILVVDVNQGFEPQTIEAVEILKEYKTPFIIAANKVDVMSGWQSQKTNSITESMKHQRNDVLERLENGLYGIMGKIGELGFASNTYDHVQSFQKEIAIVPISAKTGEGIAELLMVVTGLAQRYLEMRLKIEVSGPGRGSILERKEVRGLGTTIDVILYDGSLHVNDTIAFATVDGIVKTKIKALLKPKPLAEIRESSSKFFNIEEVSAASGIKISANDLDGALPGSPVVQVIGDEYASQINAELGSVFKTDKIGAVLKADSIGSIEAMSRLLENEGLKISKKGIGNVTKRDVMDAFAMKALDQFGSVIISFGVKTEADAHEEAAASGVTILEGSIIYKLIDDYKEYLAKKKGEAAKAVEDMVVFPGEIYLIPNSCFRVSGPAIFGARIEKGRIKPGYVLINEAGIVVGRIKGIQTEKNALPEAKKGESVAVSVEGPTYGRQIKESQYLYTRPTDSDESTLLGSQKDLINDEEAELLRKIIEMKRKAKGK